MKSHYHRGISSKNWDFIKTKFGDDLEKGYEHFVSEFERQDGASTLNTFVSNVRKQEQLKTHDYTFQDSIDPNLLINEKLFMARHKRGITQEGLARMVGVALGTIRNIEYGKNVPSVRLAMKIARVLGVSVYDIFSDEDD